MTPGTPTSIAMRLAATPFFFPGIQKHDHKDEEHMIAPHNNHLYGGHKLRASNR